jgi:hypothetical protein
VVALFGIGGKIDIMSRAALVERNGANQPTISSAHSVSASEDTGRDGNGCTAATSAPTMSRGTSM